MTRNLEEDVDSSNDEPEAKEDNSKNTMECFDSGTVLLPSDEEFADEQFNIGRLLVSNYKKTKNSILNTVKIPKILFDENYNDDHHRRKFKQGTTLWR